MPDLRHAAAWATGLPRRLVPRRHDTTPLAICAIFKDEAAYLAEWVGFHQMMGVERFFLYDNGSSDEWRAVLAPELSSGAASVTPWPRPARVAQLTAYRDCLARHARDTRWIAFIDVDEFLFSPTGDPLPEILNRFTAHPGVAVGWRVYGTGGRTAPAAGLVIENYVHRAADDHFLSGFGKLVTQPRLTVPYVTSPHLFTHYHPTQIWRMATSVDERNHPYLGPGRGSRLNSADLLRINHYYAKSESEARAKWRRGSVSHTMEPPLTQLLDPSLNAIKDPILTRFGPMLRRRLLQVHRDAQERAS